MTAADGPAEVDPKEAFALISSGVYLLDVREHDEWQAGHAQEAHHIPLLEIEARIAEIPTTMPVICVCRGGGRSARAAEALASVGFQTINLAGGMRAWAENGLPLVSDQGAPTII